MDISTNIIWGELDNRQKGRIYALLWLEGAEEPVKLVLKGNCSPEIAGRRLVFYNPNSPQMTASTYSDSTMGLCGQCLVKGIPADTSDNCATKQVLPFFMEWLDQSNGHMQISGHFSVQLSESLWILRPEDYNRQITLFNQAFASVRKHERNRGDNGTQQSHIPTNTSTIEAKLSHAGIMIPTIRPPKTHLAYKLWKLLYALASQKVFLKNTGHLSDEQLYNFIISNVLPRTKDCPSMPMVIELSPNSEKRPFSRRDSLLPCA